MKKDVAEELQIDPKTMQYAMDPPPPDEPSSGRKRKREPWRQEFTLVPKAWEIRLLEVARGATFKLALKLLYLDWQSKQDLFSPGRPITISGEIFQALGLTPKTVQRAITDLERLGLIEVERRPGRATRVTLLLK